MHLDPGAPPGRNFDLDDWKLQLPVDASGGFSGRYVEVWDLDGYQSPWFRTGPDGALVLAAPVEGATTPGSVYARSELRETVGDVNAAWTLDQGGAMAVRMQVDRVPELIGGGGARVSIGQVHGGDGQLARVYWEDGSIYWVAGRGGALARDLVMRLVDAQGREPDVSLDETFAFRVEVEDGRVLVTAEADGRTYSSGLAIDPGWADKAFYFKAGLYLGSNEATSTGSGQVSIYGIGVTHDGSDPVLPGDGPPAPPPPPPPPPVLSDGGLRATLLGTSGDDAFEVGHRRTEVRAGAGFDTVRASVNWEMDADQERLVLLGAAVTGEGSRGDDVIVGSEGANVLRGDDGDDALSGAGGADSLRGGDGADRLEGGAGRDTLGGEEGRDALLGGEGDDRLEGGRGPDLLTGGEGADLFAFRSLRDSRPGEADRLLDFATGVDRLDLSALDADARARGDQAFAWGGGGIGALLVRDGQLVADVTGDGRWDLAIDLGGAALRAGDLIL